MTPEQKAALEKATKERQAAMAKNKELNDAFNAGMEAMKTKEYPSRHRSLQQGAAHWIRSSTSFGATGGSVQRDLEDKDRRREGCCAKRRLRELQEGDRTGSHRRELLQ